MTVDRLQFTLTVTFHYLFPIGTMGLALFIAWLKSVAYLGGEGLWLRPLRKTAAQRERYDAAAACSLLCASIRGWAICGGTSS